MNRSPFRRALLVVTLLLTALAAPTLAQSDVRNFPETDHTLRGAFRVFWEANGALDIFGYPITEEYRAGERTVQYFERARFELITLPNNGWAVDLGHLGVEVTNNRSFPKAARITNTKNRRYIEQTQHIIQYGFKDVWEQRGAERIFGYPISEEINEVLADGQKHIVQYFEHSRFEFWPNLPAGKRVLISLLGRQLAPSAAPTPTSVPFIPSPSPTAAPVVPTPTAVQVAPKCDPSYPDFCIPPPPPDLDCKDVLPHKNFRVLQPDPHNFDGNHDGIGCEN